MHSGFLRCAIATSLALALAPLHAQDDRARQASDAPADAGHVAPAPPANPMAPMGGKAMTDAMGMDDAASLAMLRFDRLEYTGGDDGAAAAWSAQAWFGGDIDKLTLRSEGEHADGEIENADVEMLWSHAVAAFWDSALGARRDIGRGSDRDWIALGVQGLAPYWFEVGATAYAGPSGRSALRVEVDYDLSLTQRLIVQPRIELNAYGRDDAAARIGAGLSDAEIGIRLRYEVRREIAPYVGIEWSRRFGATAGFAREDGIGVDDVRLVAGIRLWY